MATAAELPRVNIRTKIWLLSQITSVGRKWEPDEAGASAGHLRIWGVFIRISLFGDWLSWGQFIPTFRISSVSFLAGSNATSNAFPVVTYLQLKTFHWWFNFIVNEELGGKIMFAETAAMTRFGCICLSDCSPFLPSYDYRKAWVGLIMIKLFSNEYPSVLACGGRAPCF